MTDPTMLTILAILQGLTVAGVVGIVGFAFSINARLHELHTTLNHPEQGVAPRGKQVADRVHDLNNTVMKIDGRLTAVEKEVDTISGQMRALEST